MKKEIRIVFFGVFLFINSKSFPLNTPKEEVKPSFSSSFSIQQSDTVLVKEYLLIQKLYKKEEYILTLESGLKLLTKSKEEKNIEVELLTTYLLGNVFRKIKNYDKALSYFQQSYAIFQKLSFKNQIKEDFDTNLIEGFDYSVFNNLLNLGVVYQKLKKNDSATIYYDKIIIDKSLNKKALPIKSKAFSNLSNMYFYSKKYKDIKKAEAYALNAIEINKKIGDKISEAASIASLANIYSEINQHKKAEKLYFKALNLIKYNKDNKSVNYREIFYDNLSWAMYQQKNYKAYDYLGMSYDIRDSLRFKETQKIVSEIEAKYKIDEATKKIELKKIEEKKRFLILSVLSFLLLVISGFVLYNYKLRQKNLKLKFTQKEFAQQKAVEKIRADAQNRILNATLDAKETERKEIAEILHDNVSALLSSANLHLQASGKNFKGEVPEEIRKTKQIIKEASVKIRNLSHTLVSSVLLKFGLEYAVKDIAEKYTNSQLKFSTSFGNLKRYDQRFEIKMFNIIQEFANNILKHSKAKNAVISLVEREKGILCLRIDDDGIGFDKKEAFQKLSLGMNQIEARVQIMKGKFEIITAKGKGTRIHVELPVVYKENTSRA